MPAYISQLYTASLVHTKWLTVLVYCTMACPVVLKGVKHHFVDVHNIMSFDCLYIAQGLTREFSKKFSALF